MVMYNQFLSKEILDQFAHNQDFAQAVQIQLELFQLQIYFQRLAMLTKQTLNIILKIQFLIVQGQQKDM